MVFPGEISFALTASHADPGAKPKSIYHAEGFAALFFRNQENARLLPDCRRLRPQDVSAGNRKKDQVDRFLGTIVGVLLFKRRMQAWRTAEVQALQFYSMGELAH